MLSEQEREWMKEYASQSLTVPTYDNENRYVERIVRPNIFDMCTNRRIKSIVIWIKLRFQNPRFLDQLQGFDLGSVSPKKDYDEKTVTLLICARKILTEYTNLLSAHVILQPTPVTKGLANFRYARYDKI